MRINADFSAVVVVAGHGDCWSSRLGLPTAGRPASASPTPTADAAQAPSWVASPQPGVERLMLDRVGGEQARATSIVRYAADSAFPAHTHPGGEEILVLAGVFSDDEQDYPAGCYIRNPPGSAHRPRSGPGALLFVKLQQMPAAEQQPLRVDTRKAAWDREGEREVCRLFCSVAERVDLVRLPAGAPVLRGAVEGAEALVLEGEVMLGGRRCLAGSWIRLPAGAWPEFSSGQTGSTLYLKTGALGLPRQSDR